MDGLEGEQRLPRDGDWLEKSPDAEMNWPPVAGDADQPLSWESGEGVTQPRQGDWPAGHPWEETQRLPDSVFNDDWLGQDVVRIWPNGGMPVVSADAKKAEVGRIVPDIAAGLGKPQAKKDLVALQEFVCNERLWMVYQRNLCCYRPPCWVMLDEHRAEVEIRRVLEEYGLAQSLNPGDYRGIRKLMLTHPDLQRDEEIESLELQINLRDRTLDVLTGELRPHDPNDGLFTYLNVSSEEIMQATEGPRFEAFVKQISDENPDVRRQLLELTGIAIANCAVKQFFVLVGPSHTGKSQFGRFLEELVGREFVETLRGVDDFSDKWTMGSLRGKKLVTCLDLPDEPLSYKAISIIKQLVGDDSVKGEYKGGALFTFYDKPLLVCAGNFPVRVPNVAKEQALLNRMVTIPFANPIQPDEEIQHFYRDLLDECPYIISEAVRALQDLEQRNFQVMRVPVPDEYATEEGNFALQSVQEFLQDYCTLDELAEVATADLLATYRASLGTGGISDTEFYRQLRVAVRSLGPAIEPLKRMARTKNRGYRGLRLKVEANYGM